MDNQLVSIAMCTYNGELYLKEQLNTLINQSYQNLEFIIVDDGSTDQTVSIIEQYAANDNRINFFKNSQNLGYVKNFEKAIKLCSGDYIALSDQDDIWDLNKIEVLVSEIGSHMLIYHNSRLINEDGTLKNILLSDILDMYQGDSPLPFVFYNCLSGHTCMFKSELVPHLGSFDPKYYHDWWIAFVAASFGTIKYIYTPLVSYRQHAKASTEMLPARNDNAVPWARFKEFNLTTLRHLAQVKGKAHQVLSDIIYLFEHNTSAATSLKLFRILISNYNNLYFFEKRDSKKSKLSKVNYIRKASFYKGFIPPANGQRPI